MRCEAVDTEEKDQSTAPEIRALDNKNGEVDKDCFAKGIIVTPAAMGKKPAVVILSIEPFN